MEENHYYNTLCDEVKDFIGHECTFRDERYHFLGVVNRPTDYYYQIQHVESKESQLLSCVGSLEGWGVVFIHPPAMTP